MFRNSIVVDTAFLDWDLANVDGKSEMFKDAFIHRSFYTDLEELYRFFDLPFGDGVLLSYPVKETKERLDWVNHGIQNAVTPKLTYELRKLKVNLYYYKINEIGD